MLQCTAYTGVPETDTLVALTTMHGGPDNPPHALTPDHFLLCELAEHEEHTEHAAQLWTAEIPAVRDLWLLWTGTSKAETYRFAELSPCPTAFHPKSVTYGQACVLYEQHPAGHSWEVKDPLGDLLEERARQEVQRMREVDDQDGTD